MVLCCRKDTAWDRGATKLTGHSSVDRHGVHSEEDQKRDRQSDGDLSRMYNDVWKDTRARCEAQVLQFGIANAACAAGQVGAHA